MAARLEVTLKDHLTDPEGEGVRKKAQAYFGIRTERIRTVAILTIDADLEPEPLARIRQDIFTNPVTQVSSYAPLAQPCDWVIWVGLRPGVRDNPGATAVEAIEDLLGRRFRPGQAVYTSKRYCIQGTDLPRRDIETIAGELLANDIIQQWRVWSAAEWNPAEGVGIIIPKVRLDHTPTVSVIPIESDAVLKRISDERNLALNPNDIPVIRAYYNRPEVREARAVFGLSDPTDVELEYISQARSDHCNHNTFRGLFHYRESTGAPVERGGQPLQDLHRGAHPGTGRAEPLGGVGAVGQRRGGPFRRRALLRDHGRNPQLPLQHGGLRRFAHRHRRGLPRPPGHRQGVQAGHRRLRLLRRAARLRRAAQAPAAPPAAAGRGHRGRHATAATRAACRRRSGRSSFIPATWASAWFSSAAVGIMPARDHRGSRPSRSGPAPGT